MTSTDLMNVDAFKGVVPNAAFAGLNPEEESLADGIGSSYGVVGYKGKVWTLRLRGETYTFTRPDDGTPAPFLDVIVLRAAGYKSKSYYPKDSFNDDTSAGSRPICSALDGVNPDSDVQEKQAPACAICPRNEWKVDANGRKGRECSDYKRLAVLILPSATKALLGSPLMEPVFLRIPAASLNDLAILGEAMTKQGFHYSTYITRIGFQLDKPHPQMTFKALQALTEKEAPVVIPMREDPQSYRITGENEVGKPKPAALSNGSGGHSQATGAGAATQTRPTVQPAATKPSVQQATTTSPSEDDEEAKLMRQLEAARAKKAADAKAAAEAAARQAGPVDTGFGTVDVIPPANKPASQVVDTGFALGDQSVVEVSPNGSGLAAAGGAPSTANTIADTGPAEDADAGLDERVKALLQR